MQLNTRQKKMLTIGGVVVGVGVGFWLLDKYVLNRGSGDQEKPAGAEGEQGTAPTSPPKPKEDISKSWDPDATLSYGSKRKRMVSQLQHVLNAIARLRNEPQLKVDGVWGKNTQAKVRRYFGKDQTTYNRARTYAASLYKAKGLEYPSGKPLSNASAFNFTIPQPSPKPWEVTQDPESQWEVAPPINPGGAQWWQQYTNGN